MRCLVLIPLAIGVTLASRGQQGTPVSDAVSTFNSAAMTCVESAVEGSADLQPCLDDALAEFKAKVEDLKETEVSDPKKLPDVDLEMTHLTARFESFTNDFDKNMNSGDENDKTRMVTDFRAFLLRRQEALINLLS